MFQLKAFPVHCLLSLNIKKMVSYTMCTGHGGPGCFNSNNILGRLTELERRPKSYVTILPFCGFGLYERLSPIRRESSMNPWALDWLLIEIEFNGITCLCKSLKGNVVTEYQKAAVVFCFSIHKLFN